MISTAQNLSTRTLAFFVASFCIFSDVGASNSNDLDVPKLDSPLDPVLYSRDSALNRGGSWTLSDFCEMSYGKYGVNVISSPRLLGEIRGDIDGNRVEYELVRLLRLNGYRTRWVGDILVVTGDSTGETSQIIGTIDQITQSYGYTNSETFYVPTASDSSMIFAPVEDDLRNALNELYPKFERSIKGGPEFNDSVRPEFVKLD